MKPHPFPWEGEWLRSIPLPESEPAKSSVLFDDACDLLGAVYAVADDVPGGLDRESYETAVRACAAAVSGYLTRKRESKP